MQYAIERQRACQTVDERNAVICTIVQRLDAQGGAYGRVRDMRISCDN